MTNSQVLGSSLSAIDGGAKSAPHGVVAVFQDLDIQYVCHHPRKTTTPCGAKFLLSHLIFFIEFLRVLHGYLILTQNPCQHAATTT